MKKEDLAVGQPVKVFSSFRGGSKDGVVTKIGRTLVTIDFAHMTGQFYIDTQQAHGEYGHNNYFRTLTQHEDNLRYDRLTKDLHSYGLEHRIGFGPNSGRPIPVDKIELVVEILKRDDDTVKLILAALDTPRRKDN